MTLRDLIERLKEVASKRPDALDKRVVVYPVDSFVSVNVDGIVVANEGHSTNAEFTIIRISEIKSEGA